MQNKDSEILIHGLVCLPEYPKMSCPEDKSIYCRGAGVWRKFYYANSHTFQVKRFSRLAICVICSDYIGRFGHQVYKCISCKLLFIRSAMNLSQLNVTKAAQLNGKEQRSLPLESKIPMNQSSMASDPAQIVIPSNPSSHNQVGEDRKQ